MDLQPTQIVFVEPVVWLGDCHPLVEQLSSASGLATLGSAAVTQRLATIADRAGLRQFLRDYREQLLVPVELPAIHRAWQHATKNQLRELLALDRQLAEEPRLRPFAEPSRLAGQRQLRRFKTVHDVRFVQRYLRALERGEAHAWHTLVYGVTMWLFSLPLRQGLLGYARQVTRGFIHAAAGPLRMTEEERLELFHELAAGLAVEVEGLVRRWETDRLGTAPAALS